MVRKGRGIAVVGILLLLGIVGTVPHLANIWNPPLPIVVEPGWGVSQADLDACYAEFRGHWKHCCSLCFTCMQMEWLDYEACVSGVISES